MRRIVYRKNGSKFTAISFVDGGTAATHVSIVTYEIVTELQLNRDTMFAYLRHPLV